MKRVMMLILVVAFTAVSVLGCQPEIDSSTDEEFRESAQEVIDSVEEDEQPRLKMYMLGMMLQEGLMSPYDPAMTTAEREVYIKDRMFGRLDGMTAQDIIEEAEQMDYDWGDAREFENSDFPDTEF